MIDRRNDSIDFVLEHLEKNNKKASLFTYLIGIVVMLIFAASFYFHIESLNNKLSTQLKRSQETIDSLEYELKRQLKRNVETIDRVMNLEFELKEIGQILYDSNAISDESLKNKEMENIIARETNRRQITSEERKSLDDYEASNTQQSDYKKTKNLTTALEKSAQGKTDEAFNLVNKAIEQSKNSSVAYTLKAEILSKQKKYLDAIVAQTKAIDLEKVNIFSNILPNFYNTRGFYYLQLENFDDAIKDFKTGSSIAKGDERAFIAENIIYCYLLQNKWEKAFEQANEVIAMEIEGGWKWFLRAISADKTNRLDEKKKSLLKWYNNFEIANADSLKKALEGTNLEGYISLLTKQP